MCTEHTPTSTSGCPGTRTGREAAGPWRPPPGRQVMSSGQDERLGSKGDLVKSGPAQRLPGPPRSSADAPLQVSRVRLVRMMGVSTAIATQPKRLAAVTVSVLLLNSANFL